jgi:hypothetical protein
MAWLGIVRTVRRERAQYKQTNHMNSAQNTYFVCGPAHGAHRSTSYTAKALAGQHRRLKEAVLLTEGPQQGSSSTLTTVRQLSPGFRTGGGMGV